MPDRIHLSGYGWPPKSSVQLSVWNEPFVDSGEVYNGPPRVIAEVKTDEFGMFGYTMSFPIKIRGERPPHFRDVFFLAYNLKRRIAREAKLWNGSGLWFY